MGTTPTLCHHPYILLCHFATTYTNMFCVCCVQRRVVENSVVGSAGSVVHVDVHRE